MKTSNKGRRPMTEADYLVGREKILSAARRLFIEKGYGSVSMRAIAELADMSPMSIYRYYENKRAVLIHIWSEIFSQLFTNCRNAAARSDQPDIQAKSYALAFIDYWVGNPESYMMVYGEVDRPVAGESFFADSTIVAAEMDYMAKLLAAVGIPDSELELVLQQFICIMHGVCHSLITIPEMRWQPTAKLIEGLVEALLRR